MTGAHLIKQPLGCIVVLHVVVHPGLLGGEGRVVVSEQQGVSQGHLGVASKVLLQ